MTRLEWVVSVGLVFMNGALVAGTLFIRRGLENITEVLNELTAAIKGGRITEVHLGRPPGGKEGT